MIRFNHSFRIRRKTRPGKRGQTLVEYALIIAFVSVVAIAVLISLGNSVNSTMTTTKSELGTAQNGGAGGAAPGGRGG